MDQTRPLPAGEAFRLVGARDLKKDTEILLTLTSSGTDGFVILDGVQFLSEH